jgi:4a-hydroxytetrahydrobiopterin dehydratase
MNTNIKEFIDEHDGWSEEQSVLQKRYELADFGAVKHLVGEIMKLADEYNHHPEVTFSYNWVEVKTTTHDMGNIITNKDIRLALALDETTA